MELTSSFLTSLFVNALDFNITMTWFEFLI